MPWKLFAWLLIALLTPGSSTRLRAQEQAAATVPSIDSRFVPQVASQFAPQHAPRRSSLLPPSPVRSAAPTPLPASAPTPYVLPYDAPFSRVRGCADCRRQEEDVALAIRHPLGGAALPGAAIHAAVLQPETADAVRSGISTGPAADRNVVMVDASSNSDALHIPVGRSVVLSTGALLRRVYVGDPKVLQSFASGPKEDVITARSSGTSTLILWDQAGRRRMYTVFADLDTDGLAKAITDALPDADVSVGSKADRVYLSGTVRSDAEAEALGRLAATYSKAVVNGVRVLPVHSRQIELKLRIVEVDRSRLAQYGVNFFALGGSTLGNTSTQQFSTTVTPASGTNPLTVSDPLNLLLFSAKLNAGVTIKDLEQKQVLQVLAEPTLTTLSGIAARFLSGGEFPLPVVQGGTGNSTAITIVWKPYGVKVEFTPTANADGTIRLKVAPEVSALDYTNAVTIAGFTIPALSTRKAETEVELQDGQSFIISGLLDHRTTDSLARMPGIASIPILGQIFRSKGVTLSTVDLVVMVTATVVDPLRRTPLLGAVHAEPKMVIPNLDNPRFDRDVNSSQGRRRSAAPPATPVAPSATPPETPPAAIPLSGAAVEPLQSLPSRQSGPGTAHP